QIRLALSLAADISRRVARYNPRVALRIPNLIVDAIQDTAQAVGAGAQDAVEAHTEIGRLDLARIAGADGGDAIGQHHAGLEHAHLAPILEALELVILAPKVKLVDDAVGKNPLVGEIVNGKDGAGPPLARAQAPHRQDGGAGLPVVAMHDVG